MNAPIKPQTCQSDTSYCKFGSETLLKLLSIFEDQIEGVMKSDDIEYVHKMRVTSRRLRAALPLFRFCFSGKGFKGWASQLKKVTRLLADARDLDVQIAFIEQYTKKLKSPAEKACLETLLKDHKDRRKSIQSSVVSGLEKLEASDILEDIRKFCEQTITEQSNATFDSNQVLEKAHWHISFRLDDFLSMEEYVYLENKKLKHHEMRIYAKKLRYTMEIFAPLYKNKLAKKIETITAFQDVLGEMHDCDVWVDYIPKFIDKAKAKMKSKGNKKEDTTKFEKAFLNFLAYVKEQGRDHYNQFVRLWDENKNSGFFVQLKRTTNAGLTMSGKKTKQLLANPQVKIAVLSDVHANLQALERIFEDAEGLGVEIFLNAGDSIGFGPYPNEVIEMLCEKNVLSILGNYDLEVIEGKAKAKGEKKIALEFARKELAKSCEYYLHSLPYELRFEVAGKKLFVTHGSPQSIEEHIYHDAPVERLKTLADAAKADVIILGHSHDQFIRQANGFCFVNPGSVGRPGDGNPQTAYVILSFSPFNVELIRLDYDVTAAADALRKKALPESFAQMLLRGVSLETIIEEDHTKEDAMVQNCKEIAEISQKISKIYWQDTEHYTQVARLALELFDGLINVHQLGERERCWLECAAILHDVGLSKNRGGHNKESAKLILNDTQLPFTSQERRIVASIARYHCKGLPKPRHYNLATLDRVTVHKVKILTSLLRIADGLDYTHQSIVKSLNTKVGTKRIIAECVSETESTLEEQAFNKKKDLFEKVFARKMVLVWKRQ
ncbi:MAG: YfcE family phosphodiesterase [Candidatus Bathyarchaeia archaeon]|jgi:putative phosphoesterase